MAKRLQGMILFCEDVRNEIGGGSTYVGVMGSEVETTQREAFRLVCVVAFWAGENKNYKVSGRIRLKGVAEGYKQPSPLDTAFQIEEENTGAFVNIVARLRPFDVPEEGVVVSVDVDVDGCEIIGKFKVRMAEPAAQDLKAGVSLDDDSDVET